MFKYAVPVGKLSRYPKHHTVVLRTPDLCLWVRKVRGLEGAQRAWRDEGARITYRLGA
ncbi:hypothetical protein LCGC14_2111150 [marine sediment metagenome]|uniref:Uncharacterized protein n=1 Tax=marine sediment metagenome TaxID=412755 RepID=A0A0F9GK95_9ZZZZ